MLPTQDQNQSPEQESHDATRAAELKKFDQRVILDPSSPSVVSIARVVVITLILVGIAGFVTTVVSALTHLFFMVVLSVFFAYLIDPIVQLIRQPFKERGREQWMPRPLAIAISYVIVFAVVGALIASVAPRVAEQGREFATNLPSYGASIQQRASELSRRFERLRVPDEVQADIERKASDGAAYISASIGGFLITLVTFLPWLILIPVLAFFFLKDVNTVRLAVLRTFPAGRWRIRAESVLQDLNSTLAAYTRAQLISCFVIGAICTIAFYIFGLKYALLLGILAGIFEFVPLLGPLTIAVVVVTTTAASNDGWRALYVAIFLLALRIVQDYFMYPRIVRGGIHLHPLLIIMAVLAGEQVAGIAGVFLSIPIVAIVTVFYKHILEHQGRKNLISHWFEDEPAEEPVT